MKIFLDFDDVAFYTKKFIKDYRNIFNKHGVSEDIFKKYYYQYFANKEGEEVRRYNLKSHLAGIKKELKIDTDELKKEIDSFIKNANSYVFEDVILFLKELEKNELFLVSYSKTEFQKTKIDNSKINKFFKSIKITNGAKSEVILKIIKQSELKKEEFFFLDDRVDYIAEVKSKIPKIKTILIRRKEGRYWDEPNKHCDFIVENLREALKIIKNKKLQS